MISLARIVKVLMKYMVEFRLKPGSKSKAVEYFESRGPNRNPGVTFRGAWVVAEILMDRVSGDGESRAGDVVIGQVGQRLVELPAPLGIGSRNLLCLRPRLPDAQKPNPIETHFGQAVQFGIGNIVQRCRPAKLTG